MKEIAHTLSMSVRGVEEHIVVSSTRLQWGHVVVAIDSTQETVVVLWRWDFNALEG